MLITTQTHVGLPETFDIDAWTEHARLLLHDWLVEDFQWRGRPVGGFITSVDVKFGDREPLQVWQSGLPPVPLPEPGPAPDLPPIDDAYYNMWHAAWPDLTEVWGLTGRWLHPATCFTTEDQLRLAENSAHLLVGCLDRNNPADGRRFDPDKDPHVNDMGVIAFPLRPFRALNFLYAGYAAADAMLLCAGTAVCESAVHEALELYQEAPGIPRLDPHRSPVPIEVAIRWAGVPEPTIGYADATR